MPAMKPSGTDGTGSVRSVRAYKRHLKDDWNLRTWADLDAMLHAVMTLMASEIRYTEPSNDSNRSRWPDHAIWKLVRNEIEHGLSEMTSDVPAASLSAAIALKKRNELLRLFLGIGTSLAGLERISPYEFSGFLDKITLEAKTLSKQHKVPLKTRLEKATDRYVFLQTDETEA